MDTSALDTVAQSRWELQTLTFNEEADAQNGYDYPFMEIKWIAVVATRYSGKIRHAFSYSPGGNRRTETGYRVPRCPAGVGHYLWSTILWFAYEQQLCRTKRPDKVSLFATILALPATEGKAPTPPEAILDLRRIAEALTEEVIRPDMSACMGESWVDGLGTKWRHRRMKPEGGGERSVNPTGQPPRARFLQFRSGANCTLRRRSARS